jgi:hypothetical protein
VGIGHPPRNKKDRRLGAGNIVSLRHQGEELFDVLSPLLEEAATFSDDEPPCQGIHNAPSLIEENARLRVLAVKLSNLVGDLPVQKWKNAARSCRDKAERFALIKKLR